MPLTLERATTADAAAIAALRLAVARELTARFGAGTWSFAAESEAGVRFDVVSAEVLLAREEGTVIATLRLSSRKPWLGEADFFTPCPRPWYLTSMAVAPKWQRRGIGRECLVQAARFARAAGADAIRLDSYAGPAGAGEFYRKSGYREVKRGDYNGTPLVFFELLLSS